MSSVNGKTLKSKRGEGGGTGADRTRWKKAWALSKKTVHMLSVIILIIFVILCLYKMCCMNNVMVRNKVLLTQIEAF